MLLISTFTYGYKCYNPFILGCIYKNLNLILIKKKKLIRQVENKSNIKCTSNLVTRI